MVIAPGGTAAPTVFLTNPFPGGIPAPPGSSQGPLTLMGQGITIATSGASDGVQPTVEFRVQRQLARDLVLDLAYVAATLNLPAASLNLNQLPPEYLDFARAHFAEYKDVSGAAATSAAGFFSAQVVNPFADLITNPNSSLRSATVTARSFFRRFPQYTGVTDYRPHVGSLNYKRLQINLQKRFARGVGGTASYVWSRQ